MNIKEYTESLATAERLELKSRDLLKDNQEIALRVCNGIGAEWMPAWIRKIVTSLHPTLKSAANIHDLRYYFGNGTSYDFDSANEEFVDNGIVLAKDRYGWYDIRRYIVIKDAYKFGYMLRRFGWTAYLQAIAERNMDMEEQKKTAIQIMENVEETPTKSTENVKKSQKKAKKTSKKAKKGKEAAKNG